MKRYKKSIWFNLFVEAHDVNCYMISKSFGSYIGSLMLVQSKVITHVCH
jgi:hypothetical protein